MARPVRAMLPSILVVMVLLFHFQVADSSRPLSMEDRLERQRPRADPTAPAVVPRAEVHHHGDAAETGTGRVAAVEQTRTEDDDGSRTASRADEGGAAAALSSATTTTSAPGKQQDDVVIGSRNGRPAAAVQVLLLRLRSRLARRFLQAAGVVEGGADSAARPSCGSSDVHRGCTPPSEH